MAKPHLTGKTVFAKFNGRGMPKAEAPAVMPIEVVHFDDAGIWFKNPELLKDVLAAQPILKLESGLGDQPLLFFPLTRIEWLLVSDKDAR